MRAFALIPVGQLRIRSRTRAAVAAARRRASTLAVWLCCFSLLSGQSSLQARNAPARHGVPNPENIPLGGPVHFQAHDIVFHAMDGVHLHVHSVDALLLPLEASRPVTLDDPSSMKVVMQSGSTSISAEDMTTLLNNYALPRSNLPIREVEVSFENGDVQLKGKVHKLVDLPFTASANIGVTPRGNIHLHFYKITAAGLLHKKLLDFFGMSIADIAKRDDSQSFHVHGDDVNFPINLLFPAPAFSGRLTSAKVEGDRLVQVFGVVKPFTPPPVPADHYIYFRGGVLSFGRLSMQGVDLEMLNKDEDKEFEFSMQNLFSQVLPGYFKSRPDHGLVSYIATYRDGETAKASATPGGTAPASPMAADQ